MPTIDQLAPATSASDSDELLVSQGGVARKITRSQILSGVQPEIALATSSLLGRASTGVGSPEVIAIGPNLVLQGSTLAATAAPFTIDTLPGGTVPGALDLVPFQQAGTTVSVTYAQLASGLSASTNLDLSHATVTPTGGSVAGKLSDLAANAVLKSGGTFAGPIVLSGNPNAPGEAANRAYVDQKVATALPLTGGSLSGSLSLASQPVNALHAATKAYVDSGVASAVANSGGSMSGLLTLSADPTIPLGAATKRYADQKLSRGGDTLTGPLVLASDPTSSQQAATKNYVDSQITTVVPKIGATLSGALILASDPAVSAQAATKQYVDQRLFRSGDTLTGALLLASDPIVPSQAATKNYVDGRVATVIARTGDTMAGALVLATDPSVPLQASTKQYADLKLARSGDSLVGPLYLAADPTNPLQASTKHYVDAALSGALTSAGATFVGPVLLASAPVAPNQASTKQYVDARVLRSGDTLSGSLVLASDPTTALQAATKNYVDAQSATRLALAGGSLGGVLSLASDPVAPAQAATKRYVDAQMATLLPVIGGTISGSLSLSTPPNTPQSAATKQYVDTQVATVLPRAGGTLSGALTLAGAPVSTNQAATKGYVDLNPNSARVINVTMAPYGAMIDGVTDDTAAFKAAYVAAPAGSAIYVPNGTVVLQSPGSWGVALTKQVKWIVDGTVLTDGTPLGSSIAGGAGPSRIALPGIVVGNSPAGLTMSQGSSSANDFSVNQSSYIVNHTGGTSAVVASNSRVDTIIFSSPNNYIWGALDRLIWAGTQTPSATTPAQHVGRYVQVIRQSATVGSSGKVLPQPQLWAAVLEYRDATGLSSSQVGAASLTIEMDWFGNGLDDANARTIQSLVIGQANKSGAPVEVGNIIGVFLAAQSSGSAKSVFFIAVPFSNAVLDTTNAHQINDAPVLKMAAGQAISFDAGNSNRLYYDSTSNTVRLKQGGLSFPIGRGITVGYGNVFVASASVPASISGNLSLLFGSGSYTLSLPPATTVAAGVGFTFSNLGSALVTISPNSGDSIDNGPIVLRPNDRYHIVSDNSSTWREIIRHNSVSPAFSGPVTLASYTVSGLPAGQSPGAKAYASNGRKPSEAAGAGTGVEVFFDGSKWISSSSGTAVAA